MGQADDAHTEGNVPLLPSSPDGVSAPASHRAWPIMPIGSIPTNGEGVRGLGDRSPSNVGGDERDRTADLFVANEALSQLSYTPNIQYLQKDPVLGFSGGEAGIRTLGTSKCSTVFETAPFNHSGTSPQYIPTTDLWPARWRRGWDSNPRYLAAHTISSRAD